MGRKRSNHQHRPTKPHDGPGHSVRNRTGTDGGADGEVLAEILRVVNRLAGQFGGNTQILSSLYNIAQQANGDEPLNTVPIRVKTVGLPVWMTARQVPELIGLPLHHLKRLADDGHIRRFKVGDAQQAGAFYNRDDILDLMDRIAKGLEPRRKCSGNRRA